MYELYRAILPFMDVQDDDIADWRRSFAAELAAGPYVCGVCGSQLKASQAWLAWECTRCDEIGPLEDMEADR